METNRLRNLSWASFLVRLIIGSLLLVAAIGKIPGGIAGTVGYYESLFEKSMLPIALVRIHASVIMIIEFIFGIWILSGYKLKAAWLSTSFLLISLAIGMLFAAKYEVANQNYLYVFISITGLLLSEFDTISLKK